MDKHEAAPSRGSFQRRDNSFAIRDLGRGQANSVSIFFLMRSML